MSNRFRDVYESRCFFGDIMPLLRSLIWKELEGITPDLLPRINISKVYLLVRVQQEFSNKYIDETSVQDVQEYRRRLDCIIQTIKHLNKIEIEDGEQEDCSVCLCGFVANTEAWMMPCNHRFHSNCILKWLLDYNRSCPLCRCKLPDSANTIAGCERVEITPYF
ncbi:hypothetical protein AMTR_s00019p00065410 [Amborella trichopoda]|uniref:RING-type domain-containing protein n=1 Tax=Amborella trichopoda TaxID=13333 RepID=W1PIY4_AMBTC|nr:hypothetical protein AMTR_s00019p00065410 [Amborella trichopoda]